MLSYMVPPTARLPDLAGFLTAGKALPWAQHVFGTRENTCADSNATVRAYTERLGPIAHMRQVHGNRVVCVSTSGLVDEADALFTDEPGLWLAVKTADCVPVLISSQGVVAAVHAGWRGLQAGIIEATIQAMCAHTGMHPEDFHLAIGPCISQSFYEVESAFSGHFAEKFFKKSPTRGHLLLDLPAVARAQARAAGLPETQIRSLGRCTYAEPTIFNSYRRHKQGLDTAYATQLSLIRVTPK